MAYYQRVWAQIDEDGIVQNRIICDDYEMANYLSRCTYGESAIAIEINNWNVSIGDKYIDNVFYKDDGITKCEYIPDVEEEVTKLTEENNDLTLLMADMIGGI